MIAESVSKVFERFGVSTAARNAAMRLVHKTLKTDVFQLLGWEWTEDDLDGDGGATVVRLDDTDLRHACEDPELDLDLEFVDSVETRGDEVWGIFENGKLVAYQCFSSSISEIPSLGAVTFPSDRVYLYKAFTVPAARGRRLHRQILTYAARQFDADGKSGYVTYINALNTHSLHAFMRAGFTPMGLAIHGWGRLVQLSRVEVGSPWMLVAPDPELAKSEPPPAHGAERFGAEKIAQVPQVGRAA